MRLMVKHIHPLLASLLALLLFTNLPGHSQAQGVRPGTAQFSVNRHSATASDLSDPALSGILFFTDCGSWTTSLQITLTADGKLTGQCGSDPPPSNFYDNYRATFRGTVDGQGKLTFTFDVIYEYLSPGKITSQGKEVGWYTETGKTQLTYAGEGKFTSDSVAEGSAKFSYSCKVAYSEPTGNVPYGPGGQCPGSKAIQSSKVTDTSSGNGTIPWTLRFTFGPPLAPPAASQSTSLLLAADLSVDGQEENVSIRYEEPVIVQGTVWQGREVNGKLTYNVNDFALGAQAVVSFDGGVVFTGKVDANGHFEFPFKPPANIAPGRSEHQFTLVASREGATSTEETLDVRLYRGLTPILVSVHSSGSAMLNTQAKVTGSVRTNHAFGVPVSARVAVEDSQGTTVCEGVTDDSGGFKCEFTVTGTLPEVAQRFENVHVRAIPSRQDLYEDGQAVTSLKVVSEGNLSVGVQTDKGVYTPDENIVLSGQVVSAGKPVQATLTLGVDGTQLALVQADGNGRFTYSFRMAGLKRPRKLLPVYEGYHTVEAYAEAKGYADGADSAPVLIAEADAACTPLQFQVGQVAGSPSVSFPVKSELLGSRTLSPGSNLAVGASMDTRAGDRVELRFPLGVTASVRVVVGERSNVRVAKYCLDPKGTIQLRLQTNNPSNVLVRTVSLDKVNVNFSIETPAMQIRSKSTLYYVAVNGQGATTVVVQEGVVQVNDWDGMGAADLQPGQQITVGLEETAVRSKIVPATLKPEPELERILSESSLDILVPGIIGLGLAVFGLGMCAALVLLRFRQRRAAPVPSARPLELPERPLQSRPPDLPR